jgi:PBSX family phage terminase large subunit
MRSLDELIVPAYHRANDVFLSGLAHELWLIGGRNSIKSTDAGYLVPLTVMAHPGLNAMVLRQHATDLATSVFPNIKQCITWMDELWPEQRLLERWHFRGNCREMIFDGSRSIIFHGLDDPTKRKSEKPPLGGYFGCLWLEELNEFAPEDVRSLRKSVLRGGPIGQSIYTFNPPQSKAEWVNKEAARHKPYRYVFKTTYLDVLPYHPEWLGETFIQEAEEARLANSLEYRHELLGEAIGTGGEIFPNVEEGEITDEMIARFKERGQARYGLDFGFTNHPTILTECAYEKETETIYVWYGKYRYQYFEEDIAAEIHERGLDNEIINADRAEDRAIEKIRRLGVKNIRPCWKSPDGWRETGFKFMRSSRRRIVVDSRPGRAKDVWDELSTYAFKQYKNGDFHSDYPKEKDDAADSIRYALEPDIRADYTPKVWSLPQGFRRKYAAGDALMG